MATLVWAAALSMAPAQEKAPAPAAPGAQADGATSEAASPLPEPSLRTAPEPEAPPAYLSLRGVNLATATWFAAAELEPDTAPEKIAGEAVPTSPTAMLRTDIHGGTGTLFTFLDLEGAPPAGLSALVTIGDIDGNDETFFNGEKIGETVGWGVTDNGQPRAYHIPGRLLKAGRNVLAVRLSGFSGRPTFRISREPLTFAFIPATPEAPTGQPEKPRGGVTGLDEKQARAAILEADPSTSGALEPVLRKRPSFGRFGHFLHDGLPAVSEATPTRLEVRDGPAFEVALDAAQSVELAADKEEPGLDGWHKLSRVKGTISGKPVTYTALQHLFYPGMVYTLESGAALRLNVLFSGRAGLIVPLEPEAAREIFELSGKNKGPNLEAYAVFEPDAESVPAILAVEGAAANVAQAENGRVDVTIARAEGREARPARVFVFYPTGLRRADLSSRPPTFGALAAAADAESPTTTTLRRWMRVGLHVPAAVDEYFQTRPTASAVRVYQVARYAPLPSGTEKLGSPFLMVPPQLDFARGTLEVPISGSNTTETGVLAFSGPLRAAVSDESEDKTADRVHVAWYDLPIPPMEERGLIAVTEEPDLKQLLNNHLSDFGSTASLTAVDSLYKTRVQGFQSYSYLTPENRRRLAQETSEIARAVLRGETFHQTTEPLSGIPFWWTYFIEGPSFDRFDQDWGNGLPLIGLHYFAKYTGEWDLLTQNWDGVERIFSWFAATDDWEWMRAANGLHGHGTGAGDCMNAAYAGALAYAKLARGCGRAEEFHYGLYVASRSALLALNRFKYNEFADQHDFKPESSLVLGFHEGQGFLVGELEGYSWNATSMISGNGVQPENFDLFVARGADALRDYEKLFENHFPHWADGTYRYPRPTLYQNNSGYITLPHIYLRARLRMDGFETLTEYLNRAQKNQHLWWLAPPVIAEVLNAKADAYVADWGRCAFLGSHYRPEKKKKKRLELHFDTRTAPPSGANAATPPPETVVLALPRGPDSVTINEGPVPLTDSTFANGRLTLKLRRPGVNKVEVEY